jgi:hypothetical protein
MALLLLLLLLGGYHKVCGGKYKVGATGGKPREKVIDVQELVRIATK